MIYIIPLKNSNTSMLIVKHGAGRESLGSMAVVFKGKVNNSNTQ
jgi:hypothetical protein